MTFSQTPETGCADGESELERLAALPPDILDSEDEPSLERFITLAARLFQAPVAFISLVRPDRRWFRAKDGRQANETALERSFCAHCMLEQGPMVVCDARNDERFQDNPMVFGDGAVRFCVGVALRSREGGELGTLCVIDTVPRERPAGDLLDSLMDFAHLVVEQLEFRSAVVAKRDMNERALRLSLQEKETLLQEVQHRVKNNLQIISSLLKLQADSIADSSVASVLKESRQRVLSMALIHERLHAGKQLAAIEFDSYAWTLVQGLVYSYAGPSGTVTGRVLPPAIVLSIGQAIPCGLILNELVTNALKYAYPESRSGEVTVELHESPEGRIRLAVSDQGQGLPPDFDFDNPKSLGLRIVAVLAKQLGGCITVERGSRTAFVLEFPREEVKWPAAKQT